MLTKKRGFTLIELIIVIVIIGILAAITIIGYQAQAAQARRNSAYSALSEAVKAVNVCLADGDALNPYATPAALNGGGAICNGAAVTGNWPIMGGANSIIGAGWNYTAGVVAATGITTTITVTGPAFGTPVVTPTITCAVGAAGCTRNWN